MQYTYFLIIIFFIGCGGSETLKKSNDKTPVKQYMVNAQLEDKFSVVQYDIDDIDFSVMSPKEDSVIVQVKEKVAKKVSGWRIQIATLKDFERSRTLFRSLKEQFEETPHVVYRSFHSPMFKLRIGDFLTREDARKVLPMVKELGYKSAWPVRDNIFVYE